MRAPGERPSVERPRAAHARAHRPRVGRLVGEEDIAVNVTA
jgi:hypothetical protein